MSSSQSNGGSNGGSSSGSESKGNFRWLEGRQYHNVNGSSYFFSSDEKESDRISLQHFILKAVFDGNIYAPVMDVLKNGGKLLDVGCSNAAWAMDVASEFPEAKIVGIDMVAVFPTSIKPKNCTFVVANVLHGLPFEDNTFDYVHMRLFVAALRKDEWPGVINEVIRVCKPGAYCEFVEANPMPFKLGPLLNDAYVRLNQLFRARGQEPEIYKYLKDEVIKAGLKETKIFMRSCPIGKWGGTVGELQAENIIRGLGTAKAFYMAGCGWSSDQFDERIEDCVRESDNYKGYVNYYCVYGRKE